MKKLVLASLAFALSGCAATSLVSYKVSPDYPKAENTQLQLSGLKAPVHIYYDALGVPHVEAENELDLVRAVGFAQARDRFFEMDMMRRFARGRVAELVGEQPLFEGTTVDFDRSMRGWEFEERAHELVTRMAPEERALVEAYCAGVNAAVQRHLPLEYRLLRTTPQPWTPDDVWVVGLLNAWTVSHNWQQELARFTLALSVGVERAEAIYPSEPLGGSRTLKGDGTARELPPSVAPELHDFLQSLKPVTVTPLSDAKAPGLLALAGASNAWVVSGTRSESGKPLLANDPHLSHLLPSIAYQQHLKAPGLNVIGITIPGLPWVLMGHNDRVAWGITSTVADVMDLVVERPDPSNPSRVLHEGAECPLTSREVTINVKDGEPKRMTLRRTCNGPLLNDMLPELFPQAAPMLSVRWLSNGVEKSLSALAQANRARSVEELRAAAAALVCPIQTFTAADVDGHIGTFVSGQVPLRAAHRGTFPVPGWLKKYEWTSVSAQMPGAIDSADFYAHANNLVVDPRETDVPVNVDSAPPYRYDRIVERLNAQPKHTLDSLSAIASDVMLKRAARVTPKILESLGKFAFKDSRRGEAQELLEKWDYDGSASSSAAAIFFQTYRYAVLAAVEDELPSAPLHFFMSQRYSTNVADGWFDDPKHPIWDDRRTPKVETRDEVIRAAFTKAVLELHEQLGGEPKSWRWGKLHYVEPKHPFGGKSALASLVNLERSEAGGGLDSVWKSHFELGNEKAPFRAVAGPVYRMAIDLADVNHARWILDTGASGWPGSPHYGDQFALWKTGKLAPMTFDWSEVQKSAEGVTTLTP